MVEKVPGLKSTWLLRLETRGPVCRWGYKLITSTWAHVGKLDLFLTRYHPSHVFVSRASSDAVEPWVCLRLREPSQGICTGKPLQRVLCLRKPGCAKNFRFRWTWLESWLLQLVIGWSWMRYLNFLSLSFLILKMGMVMANSTEVQWGSDEKVLEDSSHTQDLKMHKGHPRPFSL